MNDIELKLAVEEVNALLQVLGDLPSRTGAYLLMQKIKLQAEAQVPALEKQAE
jgi:hypothetical protein